MAIDQALRELCFFVFANRSTLLEFASSADEKSSLDAPELSDSIYLSKTGQQIPKLKREFGRP